MPGMACMISGPAAQNTNVAVTGATHKAVIREVTGLISEVHELVPLYAVGS